jgi:hypothetical protein
MVVIYARDRDDDTVGFGRIKNWTTLRAVEFEGGLPV